jgi:hypothetical protein
MIVGILTLPQGKITWWALDLFIIPLQPLSRRAVDSLHVGFRPESKVPHVEFMEPWVQTQTLGNDFMTGKLI